MLFAGNVYSSDTVLTCENKEAIPETYFGMHVHRFHDKRLIPPAAEFGVWRLWDAGVAWRDLEPARGTWDFRRLDLAVAISEQMGTEVGLTLGATPKWASSRPSESAFMGEGAAAEPVNLDDWDRYVETLAKRYKGRIKFYELWNEPGSAGFFSGSVATMIELSRRAYKIIKVIDPSATVVTPSPAKFVSLPWFREFIEKGGGAYADVAGYHFYTDQARPEALIDLVRQVKAIVRPRFPSMPIWNTESGLRFSTPQEAFLQGKAGLPSSSAHLARWLTLGWCLGLKRFIYYAWDNGELGLVDPSTGASRTTLIGWSGAYRWLLGTRMSSCKLSGGVWECEIVRPGKGPAFINWAAGQAVSKKLNMDEFVFVEDLAGSAQKINIRELTVTPSPILVNPT